MQGRRTNRLPAYIGSAEGRRPSDWRMSAVTVAATIVVTLLAGCGGSTTSQTSTTQEPARDAALTRSINAVIHRNSLPGAIVGIWQDGKAPYVRAFGVRDTATGQPMATNLSMRI